MALNGNDLGTAMLTAVDAVPPRQTNETMQAYRLRIEQARSNCLINYLVANTDVNVTVKVTDAALQVTTAITTPTAGPLVPKNLTGTIT